MLPPGMACTLILAPSLGANVATSQVARLNSMEIRACPEGLLTLGLQYFRPEHSFLVSYVPNQKCYWSTPTCCIGSLVNRAWGLGPSGIDRWREERMVHSRYGQQPSG